MSALMSNQYFHGRKGQEDNTKGPALLKAGLDLEVSFVVCYDRLSAVAHVALELMVMSFLSLLNTGNRDISHHAWQFSMSYLRISMFCTFVK